jgi:hypothetical protein
MTEAFRLTKPWEIREGQTHVGVYLNIDYEMEQGFEPVNRLYQTEAADQTRLRGNARKGESLRLIRTCTGSEAP